MDTEKTMIGKEFDDFKIVRQLGEGAMGKVYLAKQISLGRDVALKFLTTGGDSSLSSEMLTRFMNEAQLMAAIQHPNIVAIYKVGEVDGLKFIAMEAVNGVPVDAFFAKRPFSEAKEKAVWKAALAVVRGLVCALKTGVLHRDIKPDNILVGQDKEPKLCDFGISKKLGDDAQLTMAGTIVGSPHYISPEQVAGESVDLHSDMYSLGATIYKLLTGKVMFPGAAVIDILFKQRSAKPPSPRSLEPQISDYGMFILGKMLQKAVEDRYWTYQDLIFDIEHLLANRPPYYASSHDARQTFDFADDAPTFKSDSFLFKHRRISTLTSFTRKPNEKKDKLLIMPPVNHNLLPNKLWSECEVHFADASEEAMYALGVEDCLFLIAPDELGPQTVDVLSVVRSLNPEVRFTFVHDEPVPPNLKHFFIPINEIRNELRIHGEKAFPAIDELDFKDLSRLIHLFSWSMRLGVFAYDDDARRGCIYFENGERANPTGDESISAFYVWGTSLTELNTVDMHECTCSDGERRSYHMKRFSNIRKVKPLARKIDGAAKESDGDQGISSHSSLVLNLSGIAGKESKADLESVEKSIPTPTKSVEAPHPFKTLKEEKESPTTPTESEDVAKARRMRQPVENDDDLGARTSLHLTVQQEQEPSAAEERPEPSTDEDEYDESIGSRTSFVLTMQRANEESNDTLGAAPPDEAPQEEAVSNPEAPSKDVDEFVGSKTSFVLNPSAELAAMEESTEVVADDGLKVKILVGIAVSIAIISVFALLYYLFK